MTVARRKQKTMSTHALIRMTSLLLCTRFGDVNSKIYDLSHEHNPAVFVFSDFPPYKRDPVIYGMINEATFVDNGYYVTSEHSGTHMDVPAHMNKGGKSLSEITVDMTIAEGVTIDCSKEGAMNQSYAMPLQKIKDWEDKHGRIPDEAAVIVNFGWSSKFTDHLAYRGSSETFDFPYLSDEAGLWLYDERKIKMLAMDTFSPDSMNNATGQQTFHIHRRLLGNNRLIIENLKDPGQLPPRGYRFFAVPVKYKGSTGTQVRAFAISYDDVMLQGANQGRPLLPSLATVVMAVFSGWARGCWV